MAILAGTIPIVVATVAILGARAGGDSAPFVSSSAILPAVGMQIITGALGEELGWRGYLLPRIGQRFGDTAAAIVMASTWAAWHLPAFFTPGMPHQFIPMPSFLLTVASFGVFLAFLFNKAEQSVLPTMLRAPVAECQSGDRRSEPGVRSVLASDGRRVWADRSRGVDSLQRPKRMVNRHVPVRTPGRSRGRSTLPALQR